MEFERHERIQDRHLRGETIFLGDDWALSIVRCTLEDCRVVVDSINSAGIYRSRLTNCTVEAKRKMKNTSFVGSEYARCAFRGKFLGVDFGRSPWPEDGDDTLGDMAACDFSEAVLDLCRFFQVDVSDQRFAPWPQILLTAERLRAAHKLERSWPGRLARLLLLANDQDPALTALTGTVADFKKRYAVTEQDLQEAIRAVGSGAA